jgi:hypothetical protein
MLRVLGSPKRLCNGITRRELLLAGGAGLFGLGLNGPLREPSAHAQSPQGPAQEAPREPRGFGRARNVILLYLFGGPSHLDMLDMNPMPPPRCAASFGPYARGCRGAMSANACRGWPRSWIGSPWCARSTIRGTFTA